MPAHALQFSLSSLLLTIFGVAAVLAIPLQLPIVPATIALLIAALLLSCVALCGTVYGSGHFRAFCIGAMPPLAIMIIFIGTNTVATTDPLVVVGTEISLPAHDNTALPGTPLFYVTGILASIVSGYVAICVRWWLLREDCAGGECGTSRAKV